jgi:hypothetical protein
MRRVFLSCAFLVAGFSFAQAGFKVVTGEGRAAVAGSVDAARKAALAEALYDAAGKLGVKLRGFSHVDASGALREETSSLVDGRFKGYQILREGREGASFFVSVEAVGEVEQEVCSGKRVDLNLREVLVRAAPGVPGHVLSAMNESLARAPALLGEGGTFRVADQRFLGRPRGAERLRASETDYYAQLLGETPSPGGYSISGTMVVERERRDNLVANVTDFVVTLNLKLRDNFSGAQIGDVVQRIAIRDRRTLFGLDEAFTPAPVVNLEPLFTKARAQLEAALACKPLRAVVVEAGARGLVLSVGQEHGVEVGDYFLVYLQSGRQTPGSAWQIVRIDEVTPDKALARAMKATPTIPTNALAVLMR